MECCDCCSAFKLPAESNLAVSLQLHLVTLYSKMSFLNQSFEIEIRTLKDFQMAQQEWQLVAPALANC